MKKKKRKSYKQYKIIPCICTTHAPSIADGTYYGMPILKGNGKYFSIGCPSCGRGGLKQFRCVDDAYEWWNKLQKEIYDFDNREVKYEEEDYANVARDTLWADRTEYRFWLVPWKKTTEKKPTKDGRYLCRCINGYGEPFIEVMRWGTPFIGGEKGFYYESEIQKYSDDGKIEFCHPMITGVVEWAELPQPPNWSSLFKR